MIAAMNGHKQVVDLLIENNAKLDLRDRYQETAMDKAARYGHKDTAMLLLERTPWAKHKSKNIRLVLINAAQHGHTTLVKMILDRGINIEFKNKNGQTALSAAANGGHLLVVEMLLNYGADMETKDVEGYTPLMHAIHWTCIVARLLRCHANVEAKNKANQTAISLAVSLDFMTGTEWGTLELLLKHGAILKTTMMRTLKYYSKLRGWDR